MFTSKELKGRKDIHTIRWCWP